MKICSTKKIVEARFEKTEFQKAFKKARKKVKIDSYKVPQYLQHSTGMALRKASRCLSRFSLFLSRSNSCSIAFPSTCIRRIYSAALRSIVTLGARWFSSSSGTCSRRIWKLNLRSLRRFRSKILCEALLCSSSDSVPSPPTLEQLELILCKRLTVYFRFFGEGGVGEFCREQGAETENCRFLVVMRVRGRSVTVTTSISSSAKIECKKT